MSKIIDYTMVYTVAEVNDLLKQGYKALGYPVHLLTAGAPHTFVQTMILTENARDEQVALKQTPNGTTITIKKKRTVQSTTE